MIEARHITKSFEGCPAVSGLDLEIGERSVFGLIGTNGSGKSTLLRMAAGILKQDSGELLIDGQPVFENAAAKQKLFFISDDAFYYPNAAPEDMGAFYRQYYPGFDAVRFDALLQAFGLDKKRRIRGFSKGMKKQFFIAAGMSAGTKYLLCDETFDGLDPVMRQAAKSLFASAMEDRELTVVLASHNLRELEDICDHVGLLHNGSLLLSRGLDDMKENVHKIQVVLRDRQAEPAEAAEPVPQSGQTASAETPEETGAAVYEDGLMLIRELEARGLSPVSSELRGRLRTLVVRGSREAAEDFFRSLDPVYFEIIPLSLEEIFISETEVAGYDIRKLLQ